MFFFTNIGLQYQWMTKDTRIDLTATSTPLCRRMRFLSHIKITSQWASYRVKSSVTPQFILSLIWPSAKKTTPSVLPALYKRNHQWSLHIGPVRRRGFPRHDVIMNNFKYYIWYILNSRYSTTVATRIEKTPDIVQHSSSAIQYYTRWPKVIYLYILNSDFVVLNLFRSHDLK